eukprot:2199491-Rhodomonas_salina.1
MSVYALLDTDVGLRFACCTLASVYAWHVPSYRRSTLRIPYTALRIPVLTLPSVYALHPVN